MTMKKKIGAIIANSTAAEPLVSDLIAFRAFN
jgi:hypothetical protein